MVRAGKERFYPRLGAKLIVAMGFMTLLVTLSLHQLLANVDGEKRRNNCTCLSCVGDNLPIPSLHEDVVYEEHNSHKDEGSSNHKSQDNGSLSIVDLFELGTWVDIL